MRGGSVKFGPSLAAPRLTPLSSALTRVWRGGALMQTPAPVWFDTPGTVR